MIVINRTLLIALIAFVLGANLVQCQKPAPLAGGASEETNARVTGIIVDSLGNAAPNTKVQMILSDANPNVSGTIFDSLSDTTDENGKYFIAKINPGMYNMEAVNLATRTKFLKVNINLAADSTRNNMDTLRVTGSIRFALPQSADTMSGYIYIPGTTISVPVTRGQGFVVLDSVPAGVIASINCSSQNQLTSSVLRYGVSVESNSSTPVFNPAWRFAKKLTLNTTVSGADIAGAVYDFPILVRLNSGNFIFSQAQAGGGDLRFTKSDNTPLSYEIERWDSLNKQAEIWVKVDTVIGNYSNQFIVMYWGNSAETSLSSGAAVFDTSKGFSGVWHLAGSGTDTAFDATGNHIDGTPFNMTAASVVDGAIGRARTFNGSSQYISMENSASGALNFPQNGTYSMSVWVYADTLDTLWRAIAGKGHEQYYMQLKGFTKNRATWEFVEFQDQAGWDYTEDSVSQVPGAGAKTWMNLVGVRSGTKQQLYINGALVLDTASVMAGVYARIASDNFTIGNYARQVTLPQVQGYSYFKGAIDEVRVCSFVPSDDWIKLCYMNQKVYDALVVFGQN